MHAGIDISAGSITIATPTTTKTIFLNGDWLTPLSLIVPPGAIVALEPTGRHYSAPIITALHRLGAEVLQVDHATTKSYRETHISSHKTDSIDAATLLAIAIAHTVSPIRGVKRLNIQAEALTDALRITIEAHRRATKDAVRATNRLKQLAYNVWPSLADAPNTYLRAIKAGYTTPSQLHELAASFATTPTAKLPIQYAAASARAALLRLIKTLPPDLPTPPSYDYLVTTLAQSLSTAQAQQDELIKHLETLIHEPSIAKTTTLWQTVPSASTLAIAALHAAAHCQAHLMPPNQLRSVVGFHPQRNQSGSSSITAQTLKGYRPARAALHLWTMILLREQAPPNPIRSYFQARKAEGYTYAFQAARGKLVRVLAGIATHGQPCNWNIHRK